MKIGIVSDTHDNLEKTREIVDFFDSRVETVVHCGDMVAPFTAELFDSSFDFYAVRGNNDGEWNLEDAVEEFGEWMDEAGELTFQGEKIGVYHGTEESIVESMLGDYDYVFRGHTHEKKLERRDGTLEINPGGIKLPEQEERMHVAVLDLETGDVEFHEVD